MVNFGILLLIIILFYFLGKSADLIVFNVRKFGQQLGINIFFLGLILGFFTTLPDFSIGLNAVLNDMPEIALGNLLGGIFVLLGFVLGLSLLLNRKINTDGRVSSFLPIVLFLFLPVVLGLNGFLGLAEGIALLLVYLLILLFLFWQHRNDKVEKKIIKDKTDVYKKIFFIVLGFVLVIIISTLILRFTNVLLENFGVPRFLIGLLLFSIGTNLPEIIVTVKAWRKKVRELSIGNLIGSAMANVLVIGVFCIIKPIGINLNLSYYLVVVFMFLMLFLVMAFYSTEKKFSRQEGILLLLFYIIFLISQGIALFL